MARIQQSVQSGFSKITDAVGDPAREVIVSALSDGKAMPAGELAIAAGVSPQSASAHLQKLVDAKVLSVWSQGRFRYYRIADEDVASLIESLVDLAAKAEQLDRERARLPEPLRQSRTCYGHLAGQLGVALSNALIRRRIVTVGDRTGCVTCRRQSHTRSTRCGRAPAVRQQRALRRQVPRHGSQTVRRIRHWRYRPSRRRAGRSCR